MVSRNAERKRRRYKKKLKRQLRKQKRLAGLEDCRREYLELSSMGNRQDAAPKYAKDPSPSYVAPIKKGEKEYEPARKEQREKPIDLWFCHAPGSMM